MSGHTEHATRIIGRALLAAVVAAGAACGPQHPTDDDLLEQFRRHRPELEQLIVMFEADKGLGRVSDTFTRPDDPRTIGVTPERIAEYRRLCGAVGAANGIEGYDAVSARSIGTAPGGGHGKDPIWIHVSASGLAISGSGKGFLYSRSPSPAFDVVQDLDRLAPRASGTWIRHIDGPWYLYFDHED